MRPTLFAIALLCSSTLLGSTQGTVEDQQRAAVLRTRAAQELLARTQWDDASRGFQVAIEMDALQTDAYVGLGQAHLGAGRFGEAVRAFAGAIDAARRRHELGHRDASADDELQRLREELRQVQNLNGDVFARTAHESLRLQNRIRELERQNAKRSEPFEAPAHIFLALGSAYYRLGDRDAAEQNWLSAVHADPRLGEAWNNLAAVYLATGRKREAEDALRNAERRGVLVDPKLRDEIQRMK